MSEATKLAETINAKLDSLHDNTVSENPFSWSDTEEDRSSRTRTFNEVSEKLATFVYIPKTGIITKILLFGTLLPLLLLAGFYLTDTPTARDVRFWSWGALITIATVSAIVAAVIADDPDIDSDLSLALYTVPKGWSFSRINGRGTWKAYREKFSYFRRGDEDQSIKTRIWGYSDAERKRPFQLFCFYYETVYYVPVTVRVGKSTTTTMQKRTTPHYRYGMFAAIPESKVRFRLTEVGGDAGLDSSIKLEFGALNKAVDIFCDQADELAVRQFLSPAVQEIVMEMSNHWAGLHLDFYPGLVLVVTGDDFLIKISGIELDEDTRNFKETLEPAGKIVERFRHALTEGLDKIRKYNDNY